MVSYCDYPSKLLDLGYEENWWRYDFCPNKNANQIEKYELVDNKEIFKFMYRSVHLIRSLF